MGTDDGFGSAGNAPDARDQRRGSARDGSKFIALAQVDRAPPAAIPPRPRSRFRRHQGFAHLHRSPTRRTLVSILPFRKIRLSSIRLTADYADFADGLSAPST